MNRRLRTGLNLGLSLVIVVGVAVLLRQQFRWRDSAAAQDRAAQIVQFPALPDSPAPAGPGSEEPDPVAEELAGLDLAALRQVNPEVAGWLYIPGTEISYPLLLGTDNDYYLKHTWEGKWNGGGSIFMDFRCARSFEDFNTILYGHRMNNGSMFGALQGYADPDFWREHPNIYVADGDHVRRYAVFAAWEPGVSSIVYGVNPRSEEERREFVELCLRSSQISTGFVPGPEDKLVTLSTCTESGHDTRWVVQGVLVYEAAQAGS